MTDAMDVWNMNDTYLGLILILITNYCESRLSNDYEKMCSTLILIEKTASPKIDNDIVEANLDKIQENIPRMIIKNDAGLIVKYYPELIAKTVRLCDDTYALLLLKLEKEKMLTRETRDPRKAMGRFGGS